MPNGEDSRCASSKRTSVRRVALCRNSENWDLEKGHKLAAERGPRVAAGHSGPLTRNDRLRATGDVSSGGSADLIWQRYCSFQVSNTARGICSGFELH